MLTFFNSFRPGDIYESQNPIIISSGDGLLPVQHQAITWTNGDWYSVEPSKYMWNLIQTHKFLIKEHAFQMVVCKMPFCQGLSVSEWDTCVLRHLNYLFNGLFRLTIKKNQSSALLTVCEGNPLVTCGFPSQRASNMENVSMPWRHHVIAHPSIRLVVISPCQIQGAPQCQGGPLPCKLCPPDLVRWPASCNRTPHERHHGLQPKLHSTGQRPPLSPQVHHNYPKLHKKCSSSNWTSLLHCYFDWLCLFASIHSDGLVQDCSNSSGVTAVLH